MKYYYYSLFLKSTSLLRQRNIAMSLGFCTYWGLRWRGGWWWQHGCCWPVHLSCTLIYQWLRFVHFTFRSYKKLKKLVPTQTVLLCAIHGVCWGPRHIHAVSYWGGSVQPMERGGSTSVANENTAVRRLARDHPRGVHVYKSWLEPASTVIMTSGGPSPDVTKSSYRLFWDTAVCTTALQYFIFARLVYFYAFVVILYSISTNIK
jgi:hypothetical protein